jgi:uncharacterized protein (TIGR02453 family)
VGFRGWTTEALDFFEGLEADNSKAYWTAHKEVYDRAVRAPMDELLAELAGEFGEPKVFRPNRDVRFSADKSPYKTNIAATLSQGGYLHLSADGLGAGAGYYMMSTPQLERFRRAVADDQTGKELEDLVAAAHAIGMDISAHDPPLRTAPKGYPKDHPRIELLRQKGLAVFKHWPPGAWLATRKPKDRIAQFFRDSRPITGWLDTNVGPD